MMTYLNEDEMGGILSYEQHMDRLRAAVTAAVAAERAKLVDTARAATVRQMADQLEREGYKFAPVELRAWAVVLDGVA